MGGVLLIDKASGCTSHDVVYKVRKLLGVRQVGHAGTLDPLASGLMVIMVGQATKISNLLLSDEKGYEVGIRLGTETDTFDVTGNTVRVRPTEHLDLAQIKEAIERLQGEIPLEIPAFSAVKVDGKKLYEYARQKEEVPILVRTSRFYNLRILELGQNICRLQFECSKGAYVRAWVHQLGQDLGCGASVETLRRLKSGPFLIEQAIPLPGLSLEEARSRLIPMENTLLGWLPVDIEGQDEKMILNGRISNEVEERIFQLVANGRNPSQFKLISRADRHLLALVSSGQARRLDIFRVFPRI